MRAIEDFNAATIRRERIRAAQSVMIIIVAGAALIGTALIAPRIAAKAHCEIKELQQ